MSLDRAPLETDDAATQHEWFAPLAALIAWLAHLFDQIAKLKRIRRTTKFKPSWRDHWPDLRQCEWMRDQILASGAAQLLAGQELDLEAFIPSTEPPADYGGPCPKTPFEMNRRFLAMARFNADPEPAIRAHAKRIARREGFDIDCPLRHAAPHRDTSPGFADGGKAPAPLASLAARRGRWRARSYGRDGGGSRSSRGPPAHFSSFQERKKPAHLARPARETAPAHPRHTAISNSSRSKSPSSSVTAASPLRVGRAWRAIASNSVSRTIGLAT
jgi:hypothetical protein